MKESNGLAWCVILFLFSLSANAEIYEKKLSDGTVLYSDVPSSEANISDLPDLNVYSPNGVKSEAKGQEPKEASAVENSNESENLNNAGAEETVKYKTFSIRNVKDKQTFWNQRVINVSFDIQPKLKETDLTQLYVDGKAFGSPQNKAQATLKNLDRGEHKIFGALLNAAGDILGKTSELVIYIKYKSVSNP